MARDGAAGGAKRIPVHDVDLEVLRLGSGPPVLALHGMQHFAVDSPFLAGLARRHEVIAPSHPGFGASRRPAGFESVYDLVRLYLGLMDVLDLHDVSLIGLSFGGWIAAEMAAVGSHRLHSLVLVDALGIKVSDRETPDILDLFNLHPNLVRQARWHDPARFAPDFDAMPDEALVAHAQNWESLCLYGWSPYMHNPHLKKWLKRIALPTLVVWGESDGIVKPAYGRAYAELIPDAEFSTIATAGHHPEIEQPQALAQRVQEFLDKKREG